MSHASWRKKISRTYSWIASLLEKFGSISGWLLAYVTSKESYLIDKLMNPILEGLSELGTLFYEVCFHAVVWGIWRERNSRWFEGKQRSFDQVLCDIKFLIWNWGIICKKGKAIRHNSAICNGLSLVRD